MSKTLCCSLLLLFCLSMSCERQPYVQGERIYTAVCSSCHMDSGEGLGELYPNITNSEYLSSKSNDLPCLIRNGRISKTLETVVMPGLQNITPAEMTNLINYLNHRWGNKTVVQMKEIDILLTECTKATQ